MFETLETLPADPILGLNSVFMNDKTPNKINLSVGVYQNANGQTPIFSAVKKAETQLQLEQQSKVYVHQSGSARFLRHMSSLLFGDRLVSELDDRMTVVMTPGGCGALHIGAELIAKSKGSPTVWVSDPTWGNHYPLLQSSGLTLKSYPYYDSEKKGVDFAAMMDTLEQIPAGDVVLLHGCCHNPTGADLTKNQCDQVIELVARKKLLPFIDIAYQGFGEGLEEDACLVRRAASCLPEVIVAASCSKNFGVYRERVGAIAVITQSPAEASAVESQIFSAARTSYSMAPYHGGGVVGYLLDDAELKQEWQAELEAMRLSIGSLRSRLVNGLNQAQNHIDFSFLRSSKGMFSYLGISKHDIMQLRADYGIYLLESGRINIAGLSEQNLPILVDRIANVITRRDGNRCPQRRQA